MIARVVPKVAVNAAQTSAAPAPKARPACCTHHAAATASSPPTRPGPPGRSRRLGHCPAPLGLGRRRRHRPYPLGVPASARPAPGSRTTCCAAWHLPATQSMTPTAAAPSAAHPHTAADIGGPTFSPTGTPPLCLQPRIGPRNERRVLRLCTEAPEKSTPLPVRTGWSSGHPVPCDDQPDWGLWQPVPDVTGRDRGATAATATNQ